MPAPNLTHRTAHATRRGALEITARYSVQFAAMILQAEQLMAADFGLIATLLVFTAFAAPFVVGGFGTAVVPWLHSHVG